MGNRIDIEGYEEITSEETGELRFNEFAVWTDLDNTTRYFKRKEIWPRVFEDDRDRKITVAKDGEMVIWNTHEEVRILFDASLPTLYKAVKLSEEIVNAK